MAAALLIVFAFGSQWTTLGALNQRAEQLDRSVASVQADNTQLQLRRDRVTSDTGVEERLREMGWLKEGETAIVPRPELGNTAGRTPFEPERVAVRLANWQRWWQWFFGGSQPQ